MLRSRLVASDFRRDLARSSWAAALQPRLSAGCKRAFAVPPFKPLGELEKSLVACFQVAFSGAEIGVPHHRVRLLNGRALPDER